MKLHIITFNPPLVYMCLFTLSYDILIASRLVNKLIGFDIEFKQDGDMTCLDVYTKISSCFISVLDNQIIYNFHENLLQMNYVIHVSTTVAEIS